MAGYIERRLGKTIDQERQVGDFMYKGLQTTSAFQFYFKNGGITPNPEELSRPRRKPWISITHNWREAEVPYGATHGIRICFAIISPEKNQPESGDYLIPWRQVKKIIVDSKTLDDIHNYYRQYSSQTISPTISWYDFMEKVVKVVKPDRRLFRRELLRVIRS